jgi:probable F420-dependent oxidoreductase
MRRQVQSPVRQNITMKFSVCLPTGFEGLIHSIPFVKPGDFVRLAQQCERLGYDSVWGNDHITTQHYVRELFPDMPPNFYEPLVTMSMIAGATTTLRLGTALLVLPMREPVYLAKQISTLDQLSGGRFTLGVGIGAYREEFAAQSPRLVEQGARRGDMMDEALDALHRLLTEQKCSFDGKHYAFHDIEMFPKPVQRFPIYVGGHNLEAVERAARWGSGWLPAWRPMQEMKDRIALLRDRTVANGRQPGAVEVAPQFSVTIANTVEEAEAKHMASGLVAHRKSLAYTGRDLSQQLAMNLVGSPEAILEKVDRLHGIGIDHFCALIFPTETIGEMYEQVEWFAEAVLKVAAPPRAP